MTRWTGRPLDVSSRREWRRWLRANYKKRREVWLHIYRVGANPRKIALAEAVEEALCYGWIDSVMRPVDSQRFMLRFSPRRRGSIWAESNRRRVIELAGKRKMTRAGLAALPAELLEACRKARR
jgi:uncharacterized protein YdeI (YjbR/CyaY-like superfamily)